MCSINHDLKAIFVHTPKTGGLYVEHLLNKYYGFESFYLTRKDHGNFVDGINKQDYSQLHAGFLNIKKQGFYRYYETSDEFNEKMNMNDEKWNSYYKFTFIRNPYERLISSYNYLFNNETIPFDKFISNRNNHSPFMYTHVSISQYDHLINKEEKLEYNYLGNFDKINEDLVNILFELGITKIKHGDYIKNNIKINKSTGLSKPYFEYIDSKELLEEVNKVVESDLKFFNFKKYESIEEMLNESKLKIKFDNLELYNKLLSDGKIENDTIRLDDDNILEIKEEFKLDDDSILELNNVFFRDQPENKLTVGKLNKYLINIKEDLIRVGPLNIPKEVIEKLFKNLHRTRDPDKTRVFTDEQVERMTQAAMSNMINIRYNKTDNKKEENESNNKFTCDENNCNAGEDCCVKDKKV
tara:strand:- start:1494 stop:2729 length:1236 start_codon:yes stop_codon:yes gene_type:complete